MTSSCTGQSGAIDLDFEEHKNVPNKRGLPVHLPRYCFDGTYLHTTQLPQDVAIPLLRAFLEGVVQTATKRPEQNVHCYTICNNSIAVC